MLLRKGLGSLIGLFKVSFVGRWGSGYFTNFHTSLRLPTALRNLLTGLVLLFWLVAIIYNGLLIVRKLDTNADASAQKAQKQVLFYVKMLSMGSFVGFAAKLLSVFNIGKTLYARPPCEGDGVFHFNHFQLALLTSFGKYTF